MESVKEIKDRILALPMEKWEEAFMAISDDDRSSVQSFIASGRKKIDALQKEKERIRDMQEFETRLAGGLVFAGIDEAGRGPLAGPVVAAAVIMPAHCELLYINDSKKLNEKKRDELFDAIKENAVAYGIGMASPERIDEINILQATYEAMRSAVSQLSVTPEVLVNDAVKIPGLKQTQKPVIKGDAKCYSIAAASILAKVTRDRIMTDYALIYPEYGFEGHKGYGSAAHIEALKKYGPCPIHRRTFITHFTGEE